VPRTRTSRCADHRHPRPNRSTSPKIASAFKNWCSDSGSRQPANATARTETEALALAREVGFRAGGATVVRARRSRHGNRCYEDDLRTQHDRCGQGVQREPGCCSIAFSDDAIEVDVDAVCDGEQRARWAASWSTSSKRVHSGDSGCPWILDSLSVWRCKTRCASSTRSSRSGSTSRV
jgi:hypothetical protein